jgi:L-lactate dehydrogenase complex protein LldG
MNIWRQILEMREPPPPDPRISDRDQVLMRVQKALAKLPKRAAMPLYDRMAMVQHSVLEGRDLVELLGERMQRVNARLFPTPTAIMEYLEAQGWRHGYCAPILWRTLRSYFPPHFKVELHFEPSRLNDYQFSFTLAAGAIAETGTIILSDEVSGSRLSSLAPWAHFAVILREDIVPHVPRAVRALGLDRSTVWCTGPSKTADVEGILIEGVHGPGVQGAVVIEERVRR